MIIEGVLPVFKPIHYTSHDVVAKVRGILRIKKIGHTGTLDPLVTGVLPLCIGRATKIVEYLQEQPKAYEAVLTLGVATDTEDRSGNIIASTDKVTITETQIIEAMNSFIGEINQTPPMFSAVKMGGQRLYELARKGIEVERQSRKVQIHTIQVKEIKLHLPHPEIKFVVSCSKGTYIRTLCVDIGLALGYPAMMSDLIRISSGNIDLAQCVTFEEIMELTQTDQLSKVLIPIDQAISFLPSLRVSDMEALDALQGKTIYPNLEQEQLLTDREVVRLYSLANKFLGLFRWEANYKAMLPEKVFSQKMESEL